MKFEQQPYILENTNFKHVSDHKYEVAIQPWGATEAHNFHLPYGTDSFLAKHVAEKSAEMAWEKGARPIVLPTIPYGVNTGQMDIKLCVNMNPSTQLAVLKDIVQVLDYNKISKLVLLNGHGGNHFSQFIRELSILFPKVFICSLNWWEASNSNAYFEEPGDHAGEMETSTLLAIYPELILPLSEAGDGKAKRFKLNALRNGWVKAQRQWSQVTVDTGVGNPSNSSAEKGNLFLKHVIRSTADFLAELDMADLNNMYE